MKTVLPIRKILNLRHSILVLGTILVAGAAFPASAETGPATLSKERIGEIIASPDRSAADRTNDIVRAGLILIALLLVAYETFAIVPAMAAITDVHSPDFADLHQRSTIVYGGVVVLALAALIMAAVRGDA